MAGPSCLKGNPNPQKEKALLSLPVKGETKTKLLYLKRGASRRRAPGARPGGGSPWLRAEDGT
jgi:hypothetical protein